MFIGSVEIKGCALLSPMAGVTDSVFRSLCSEQGAAMCTTEMVSAKGLVMGDRKSAEIIDLSSDSGPVAIQIFASEPESAARCVEKVMACGPDIIDINMGCPMPKIVKNGAGSALMNDPHKAEAILRAVVSVSSVPVTVKIRLGTDPGSINCVEFAKRMEQAGAAAVTVHARTAAQMYAPPTHPEYIRAVREVLRIPVIANGDVFSAADAVKLVDCTGCGCVAVGRGALGYPWIFREINALNRAGVVIAPA
ncbi:MAG: tRNA-dihydrouridine synthase family protein, partial [Clostridia bacterium]|nr:tRNA-dihydrouridine synthase family protein [Clostridia bacterium]